MLAVCPNVTAYEILLSSWFARWCLCVRRVVCASLAMRMFEFSNEQRHTSVARFDISDAISMCV